MSELDQKSAPGCGACVVASFGNCKGHLMPAARVIAGGFVNAGWEFDASNPKHISIVAAILAEDIKEDGRPVAYKMPEDPAIQEDFFKAIRHDIIEIKSEKLGLG